MAIIAPLFSNGAGNKDNFNITDDFEILPNPTPDCRDTCICPSVFEKWLFSIVATSSSSSSLGLIPSSIRRTANVD